MNIFVYYEDTDATGIVYHPNYLKFCDRARSDYFFNTGTPVGKQDGHLIIHSLQCKYISPAKVGDKLYIESKILKLKKTSIELEQSIYLDDKVIFKLEIKMLYVVNKKPHVFPEEMIRLFNSILKDKWWKL